MKAILHEQYGGPEILQVREIEKPVPGPKQVLVKVFASTVNRTDCAILRAKPFIMRFFHGLTSPKMKVPGTDFTGVIEATGKDVRAYEKGDKVFGFNDLGVASKAEYLVISEDGCISKMPKSISYEKAAASMEGAHYAYNFINKVELSEGDKVLVNGATGAIGSAMVQLLKSMGVSVTAVGNTKNLDLMKSLGADAVVDYTQEDFTLLDDQFDFIFDAVGKSSFGRCKQILKSDGTYLSSELGSYIQNPFLALITSGSSGRKVKFPVPVDIPGSIKFIKGLMEEGKFNPVIDRIYQLDEVKEAYNYVETGEKTGNVVVKIN
ncbi:NAD(P)-dependent alcohol dehydrogenase [Gracilimonas sp.]|uniref:NAD(P)-dependent alcohol dehydrogenase n=1 Tax=Gracilimonas sp. TaxID=1974203 RepID=UPI003D109A83